MNRLLLLAIGMFFAKTLVAQVDSIEFSLLRQFDKVSPINVNTPYLKLKSLPFEDKQHFLGFGGGYRFQVEGFINEQFDKNLDQTDLWYLNRIMLHGAYKYKKSVHVFGELSSATIFSKQTPTPVDRDFLAVNQLFISIQNNSFQFLIGRQNMRLGSGRLVDIREGPNVRLSFDMTQLRYSNKKWDTRLFFAIPVAQNKGIFDNDFLHAREYVGGGYATKFCSQSFNADFYVIQKFEADKTWNKGQGNDNRTSIGTRLFGNWKGFVYDFEALYQFGQFASRNINAYTASLKIFKEISIEESTFDIGLKTELISGDKDLNDNFLNTFDALYPRGAYFGRVARFGPSNLIDVHPWIATRFKNVEISLDYVAFWRYSTSDGLYNPALILDYPSVNSKRFIGHQIGTIIGWETSKYLFLELEGNLIFPDAFLIKSGLRDLLGHTVVTAEYRF